MDDDQSKFANHVVNSCKRHMGAAFFLAGLVEETAELIEAMDEKVVNAKDMENNVISELGDVLWYANAIVESLPGGKMSGSTQDSEKVLLEMREDKVPSDSRPLLLIGKVCGAVKKFLRGDRDWKVMRRRVEPALNVAVSTMVHLTASKLNASFREVLIKAMEANIVKVEARLKLNTIRGDGARETLEQVILNVNR